MDSSLVISGLLRKCNPSRRYRNRQRCGYCGRSDVRAAHIIPCHHNSTPPVGAKDLFSQHESARKHFSVSLNHKLANAVDVLSRHSQGRPKSLQSNICKRNLILRKRGSWGCGLLPGPSGMVRVGAHMYDSDNYELAMYALDEGMRTSEVARVVSASHETVRR